MDRRSRQGRALAIYVGCGLLLGRSVYAQAAASASQNPEPAVTAQDQRVLDRAPMNMSVQTGWQLMQDAVVFAELDHQGGPRGGNQLVAPNWWMGHGEPEHVARSVHVYQHAES